MLTDSYGETVKRITVRVQRQDDPDQHPYWERFEVDYEPDMNVISVLQRIATKAETAEGQKTTPVAWNCGCLEEVCGACTMVINGRVRQSCSSLVDNILSGSTREIVLQPMSKFPVLRDLVVDRSRAFRALQRVKAWIPVDTYYDMGAGPKQSRTQQEANYPLSECMTCGCCLEACPQYLKIEVKRNPGETDLQFEQRKNDAYDTHFIGAHAISQAVLFNSHPTGKNIAATRLEDLTGPGGIQVCGNCAKLRSGLPERNPADHVHRPRRAGRNGAQTKTNV